MRRADGKDKAGKEMNVRPGVADVLKRQNEGAILFVYSGGLHHVQTPGQALPRVFKRIFVNLELVDIANYKRELGAQQMDFSKAVVDDMQNRLEQCTPHCQQQPYQRND